MRMEENSPYERGAQVLVEANYGNGESIFVWHEDEPLVQKYGNRIVYDSNKVCFGVKMSCILFGSGFFFVFYGESLLLFFILVICVAVMCFLLEVYFIYLFFSGCKRFN